MSISCPLAFDQVTKICTKTIECQPARIQLAQVKYKVDKKTEFILSAPEVSFTISPRCVQQLRNQLDRIRKPITGLLCAYNNDYVLDRIKWIDPDDDDIGLVQDEQQCFCVGVHLQRGAKGSEDFTRRLTVELKKCAQYRMSRFNHTKASTFANNDWSRLSCLLHRYLRIYLHITRPNPAKEELVVHQLVYYPHCNYSIHKLKMQPSKFVRDSTMEKILATNTPSDYGYVTFGRNQEGQFRLLLKDAIDTQLSSLPIAGVWVKTHLNPLHRGQRDTIFWTVITEFLCNASIRSKLSLLNKGVTGVLFVFDTESKYQYHFEVDNNALNGAHQIGQWRLQQTVSKHTLIASNYVFSLRESIPEEDRQESDIDSVREVIHSNDERISFNPHHQGSVPILTSTKSSHLPSDSHLKLNKAGQRSTSERLIKSTQMSHDGHQLSKKDTKESIVLNSYMSNSQTPSHMTESLGQYPHVNSIPALPLLSSSSVMLSSSNVSVSPPSVEVIWLRQQLQFYKNQCQQLQKLLMNQTAYLNRLMGGMDGAHNPWGWQTTMPHAMSRNNGVNENAALNGQAKLAMPFQNGLLFNPNAAQYENVMPNPNGMTPINNVSQPIDNSQSINLNFPKGGQKQKVIIAKGNDINNNAIPDKPHQNGPSTLQNGPSTLQNGPLTIQNGPLTIQNRPLTQLKDDTSHQNIKRSTNNIGNESNKNEDFLYKKVQVIHSKPYNVQQNMSNGGQNTINSNQNSSHSHQNNSNVSPNVNIMDNTKSPHGGVQTLPNLFPQSNLTPISNNLTFPPLNKTDYRNISFANNITDDTSIQIRVFQRSYGAHGHQQSNNNQSKGDINDSHVSASQIQFGVQRGINGMKHENTNSINKGVADINNNELLPNEMTPIPHKWQPDLNMSVQSFGANEDSGFWSKGVANRINGMGQGDNKHSNNSQNRAAINDSVADNSHHNNHIVSPTSPPRHYSLEDSFDDSSLLKGLAQFTNGLKQRSQSNNNQTTNNQIGIASTKNKEPYLSDRDSNRDTTTTGLTNHIKDSQLIKPQQAKIYDRNALSDSDDSGDDDKVKQILRDKYSK